MLLDPAAEPLATGVVGVGLLQKTGGVIHHLPLFVAVVVEPDLAPPPQPQLVAGKLGTATNPGAHEHHPLGHVVGHRGVTLGDRPQAFGKQLRRHALIGLENVGPVVAVGHIFEHPGALLAVAGKGMLHKPYRVLGGDGFGAIAAAGVHHNHVVGHQGRLNAGGNIPPFVVGQDKN